MMTKDELLRLLERISDRTASTKEIAQYNSWCDGFRKQHIEIPDMEAIKSDMLSYIHQQIGVGTVVSRLAIRRIVVAAAAVAAIVFGIWFFSAQYMDSRHPEFISGSQYINDVKPGRNTATITLANGETINLSDAKTGVVIGNDLTYNDGTEVALLSPSGRGGVARERNNNNNPLSPQGGVLPVGEGSKVQMFTASTPRGGTYQVILPDGTKVWLNADSKISFPSKFIGEQRRILLSGEAYFEVAKTYYTSLRGSKMKQSFVVVTDKQEVEVLGTHFNINSYADEAGVRTTLLEGSVKVSSLGVETAQQSHQTIATSQNAPRNSKKERDKVVLKPGQQSITNDSDQLKVKEVDVSEAIAWKNGVFKFDNVPLEVVMRQLARWYDIEVTYQGTVGKETYNGVIDRKANLSRILKILEKGGVSFKIEGKKLTVIP